jgi:hypothetical protein
MTSDRDDRMVTIVLAGGVSQGAEIDASFAGQQVAIPADKIDSGDVVFRVAAANLRGFGIERDDILVVETRPEGHAATGELVLVMLRERTYVGRWWTKRGRRALLNHALVPIVEDDDLRVIGAVTVVVRESGDNTGGPHEKR